MRWKARVNPEVAKMLKSNQNSYLREVEEILGRTVLVKSDPLLHQEKFGLAQRLLRRKSLQRN